MTTTTTTTTGGLDVPPPLDRHLVRCYLLANAADTATAAFRQFTRKVAARWCFHQGLELRDHDWRPRYRRGAPPRAYCAHCGRRRR